MNDMERKAIDTAFKLIGLNRLNLGFHSKEVIIESILEQFNEDGYIRALENMRRSKECLKAQAEHLSSVAD